MVVSQPEPQSADSVSDPSHREIMPGEKSNHHGSFVFLVLFFMIVLFLPFLIVFGKKSQNITKSHNSPGKFRLVESSPADQDATFSVSGQPTVVFSKSVGVPENDLQKYFQISPQVQGAWHIEKNGQVVYFSSGKFAENQFPQTFTYNSVYRLTIKKEFFAKENQPVSADTIITFKTKQNNTFSLRPDKKLLSVTPSGPVTIGFTSYSYEQTSPSPLSVGYPVTVLVKSASETQFLKYFSYKSGKNPLYEYSMDASTDSHTYTVPLERGNVNGGYQINLTPIAFPKTGLYYIVIKTDQGSDDLFVSVSTHSNQVALDKKATYIWTTDLNSGSNIAGVTARIYSVQEKPVLLDTVITGSDGIAKSTVAGTKADFIITQTGTDIAISLSKTIGYYGFFSTEGDTFHVFSYSDRPVYRPGDMVHYKAVVRKRDHGVYGIASGTMYVQLSLSYDSPPSDATYIPVTFDTNGTVTYDLKLPKLMTGVYPQILLFQKNTAGIYAQIDSLPLVVESYRKPDLDITATAAEKEYVSGDTSHITVFAKTNFGQPLTNVDFSYRILISSYTEVKNRTSEDISSAVSGYYGNGDELTTGNGRFDSKGVAQLTIPATLPASYEMSQLATLEITPKIGAAPSIGKIVRLIHRGDFAIFIDGITGDTKNGISGKISAVNHAIPRTGIAGKDITLSLYKVISDTNKQLLTAKKLTTAVDGTGDFSFPQTDVGNYEIVAVGKDGRDNTVTTRQQIYIGEQFTSSLQQKTLDIQSQKTIYKTDETAAILVTANFQMSDVVVAITNDGGNTANILSIAKSSITASSWNFPVQIRKEMGDKIGVNVYTVTQGQVVEATTYLTLDLTGNKITSSISFDKQWYKPGDTVSATITTKDDVGNPVSADNSISVIDASVLQIGQLNGDIYDSFYGFTPYFGLAHFNSTTGIAANLAGGGGGCFLEGTQILMGSGQMKNIQDVQRGDTILTRASDSSDQRVSDTVVNIYRHTVTDYLTINNRLHVTWIHRIFLNNAWHEAKDAKIGDTLLDDQGNPVVITSVVLHIGQFVVYNLTTLHYHTFFADGIYVHNEKGVGPREHFADTAYWNPHLHTDGTGTAHFSFVLPDNITTFTSQVFSNAHAAQFGQTTGEFIVKKDYAIIPAIANFYFQGDTPEISSLLQNSSGKDTDITVSLTIKELHLVNHQKMHVRSGDFGTASFPVSLESHLHALTYQLDAKDADGNVLDSVLVNKPLLPKGQIIPSWMSFQGSKEIVFSPLFPDLDFNSLSLSVVPSIITGLFHATAYENLQPSVSGGKSLYAYSYILAKTRDGQISPTSYNYASVKNTVREQIMNLLATRQDNHWNLPAYDQNESFVAMNLWLAQGLSQAQSMHMVEEITNIPSLVSQTETFISSQEIHSNPPSSPTAKPVSLFSPFSFAPQKSRAGVTSDIPRDEQIARHYVLQEQIQNEAYQNTPESVAITLLHGDVSVLGKLRALRLVSANDRYIWDGSENDTEIFAALAMIEKGTKEDADKAMKGLSFYFGTIQTDPFALLAGLKYAERNGFYIDKPNISVSVNKSPVFKTTPDASTNSFEQTFLTKNTTDGSIHLSIAVSGDVPVYTTVIQEEYQSTPPAGLQGQQSQSLYDKIKKLLPTKQDTDTAAIVDLHLTREYQDLSTGAAIPAINQGTAGLVVLSAITVMPKHISVTQSHTNNLYSFILEDALIPSFIYLDQTSGNSPQFQNALNILFPGTDMNRNYFIPSDYSDESVFFSSSLFQNARTINLPYVVYNTSKGNFYHPKTALLFPILGVLSTEK